MSATSLIETTERFLANMKLLEEAHGYTRQQNVVKEPEADWVSHAIQESHGNHQAPFALDSLSKLAFERGTSGNAFTGLVEIATKGMYLFPLAADPDYGNTAYPYKEAPLPEGVLPPYHAPLIHQNQDEIPGHEQLAQLMGKPNPGVFVGFIVKKIADGSAQVITVTSRSQNRAVFRRIPGTPAEEAAEAKAKSRQDRQGADSTQARPGVPSEAASENWTRLIVRSIAISLPPVDRE